MTAAGPTRSTALSPSRIANHEDAVAAAKRAAAEQEVPGAGETIEYEDEKGIWHVEFDPGTDRPATEVADD